MEVFRIMIFRKKFFSIRFLILTPLLMSSVVFASTNKKLEEIEVRYKMRVGIYAIQGKKSFSYRETERFSYCSVFKWVLCANILKMVDNSKLDLNRQIQYGKKDILKFSPETSKNLSKGKMSIRDLCSATITQSDNTAAILLSSLVEGTSGLKSFARSVGDETMRFDRPEPDLNSNIPGDERDTTTPMAMTNLLKNLLTGPSLTKNSRKQLLTWLQSTTTGANRIRAAVPKEWIVGNKTGTGDHGAANDVAVIFPVKGEPIYMTIFTTGDGSSVDEHEKGIAEAAGIILEALK